MKQGVLEAAFVLLLAAATSAAAAPAPDDAPSLAKIVASAAASHKVRRIAVVPFTAPRGSGSYDGAVVSERLVIQILARGELDVVERRLLEQVLEEQRLGVFGIMDPGTVKALGKVLGVDAILTGTVVSLKGDRVEVNARLIHAETAQVLAASSARMAKDWEDRPIVEDAASTWIVPAPRIEGDGFSPRLAGNTCHGRVDAIERRLVDFKARYWAERLKDPSFSIRTLKRNPGSEIRDDELRGDFFRKLREHYDAGTPALTEMERAELGRGLQEIKVLTGLCES
jgi:TolB-like protein